MSRTVKSHLAALLLRCGMFFFLLYTCFRSPNQIRLRLYQITFHPNVINVFWLILTLSMLRRLAPQKHSDNLGYQKQFAICFQPTDAFVNGALDTEAIAAGIRTSRHGIGTVALVWCLGNGLVFALYAVGAFDDRILLLLSAAYAVCDIICILFYCPFQRIWMQNRCCTTCRIYNWDFMMLCTPLLAIRSFYTWSLCALAALLLIRWEVSAARHPERFLPLTNQNLHCRHCTSKLCQLKRNSSFFSIQK